MQWLDRQVVRFASSEEYELLEFAQVTSVQRLWLHTRAEQLGLTSETVQRQGCGKVATLHLLKPHGWCLHAVPLPRFQAPRRRRRRRRLRCQRCYDSIDDGSAVYHDDGWGPLCVPCELGQKELYFRY